MTPDQLYFNAWDIQCKEPFGAVEAESFVTLHLTVSRTLVHKRVALILRKEGGAQRRLYFTKADISDEKYLYTLRFRVGEAGLYFYLSAHFSTKNPVPLVRHRMILSIRAAWQESHAWVLRQETFQKPLRPS